MSPSQLLNKKFKLSADVTFVRADGTPAENAIYSNEIEDGEIVFFELLGQSGITTPYVKINGKQTYRRLFIQRVYPQIDEKEYEQWQELNKAEKSQSEAQPKSRLKKLRTVKTSKSK